MKCSLGISHFLEEISSLSHSVVFLSFFALIAEEGFLISSCLMMFNSIEMRALFGLSLSVLNVLSNFLLLKILASRQYSTLITHCISG